MTAGADAARAVLPGTDAAPPARGRDVALPRPLLVAYALPAAAVGLPVNLLHFFYLKFATDVLLIAPAAIGLVFGASKLWDAVSDPLVGYWSDRTRSRWGRRRPWVLASALPLGVATLALWSPPSRLGGAPLLAWISVAVFAFYAAQTAFNIPHASWGAELSLAHHERSRVFAGRELADKLGLFAALGALAWLEHSGDPRQDALPVAGVCALLVLLACLWATRRVEERPDFQERGPRSPFAAFGDVWRNPPARRLLGVFFLEHLGFAAVGVLLPFASEYLLRTPGFTAYYMLAFVLPILASIPAWLRLSRRFGKKRVWVLSMWIKIAAFGVLFTLPPDALPMVFACIIAIGVAHGCGSIIPPSIQADLVDVDEHATHERKEGTYFAAWNLTGKAALALSLAVNGLVMDAAGFQPNVEQNATVLATIRLLMAGVPCALLIVATCYLRGFQPSEASHGRIRLELDRRAARRSSM